MEFWETLISENILYINIKDFTLVLRRLNPKITVTHFFRVERGQILISDKRTKITEEKKKLPENLVFPELICIFVGNQDQQQKEVETNPLIIKQIG